MDTDTSTKSGAEAQTGADSANGGSAQLVQQAKQQAQQVVEKTQQKAGEVMDQARAEVRSRVDDQKSSAADTLDEVARTVRSSGQHMRQEANGQGVAPKIAEVADSAADAVQHVSQYLRDTNVDEMVGQVEGFARHQPAVFLGSAFALGFLAARFLKSSSPNGQTAQSNQSAQSRQPAWSESGPSREANRRQGQQPSGAGAGVRSGYDTAAA